MEESDKHVYELLAEKASLRARVAELEQDYKESLQARAREMDQAEQHNAELVEALREVDEIVNDANHSAEDRLCAAANRLLNTRAESDTPAKHPDTEIVDWLDAQFQSGDDWCRLFPLGNTIREAYAARKQGGSSND